jgi:hypothetical protein
MNKLAISTLAALVAVAGLAAPALAFSSLTEESSSNDNFNEDIVLRQLQDRGLEVTELSDWNGVIRASVKLDDGRTTFQYFDIATLQPVSAIGATLSDTRVLSEQDVGAQQRAQSLDTLTYNPVDED